MEPGRVPTLRVCQLHTTALRTTKLQPAKAEWLHRLVWLFPALFGGAAVRCECDGWATAGPAAWLAGLDRQMRQLAACVPPEQHGGACASTFKQRSQQPFAMPNWAGRTGVGRLGQLRPTSPQPLASCPARGSRVRVAGGSPRPAARRTVGGTLMTAPTTASGVGMHGMQMRVLAWMIVVRRDRDDAVYR